MSNLGRQFDKPKRKRTMAYSYEDSTYCPSCHKHFSAKEGWFGDEKPTVKFNTDYERGDVEVCTGGCGRTIYGKKGTYE